MFGWGQEAHSKVWEGSGGQTRGTKAHPLVREGSKVPLGDAGGVERPTLMSEMGRKAQP